MFAKSMMKMNSLKALNRYFFCASRLQYIRNHSPLTEYQNLQPKTKQHLPLSFKIHEDKQTGIRFLIEQGGFPGCSDLGICLKLGIQDQSPQQSGSLSYFKSIVHMKPTMEQMIQNYLLLQQTGSFFDFNFDTTTSYAKCSFLEEDKNIMIDMLLDLVLQQKSMTQEEGQFGEQMFNIHQLVRRTAFKGSPLGKSDQGIGNTLTNKNLLNFQNKIAPKNTLISLANLSNPQEIMNLILSRIKTHYPKFLTRKVHPPAKNVYSGGLGTFINPSAEFFDFAVAFPGAESKSKNMELFNILRILMGQASSFSSGGPGKGMHSRCTKYLLNRVQCVQKASFINDHFEQHGLFGLTVSGPDQTYLDVINCTLDQMKRLKNKIPEQQLNRSKNILISSLYTNTQRQSDRLQQMSRHIFAYGKVRLLEFEQKIRKVSAEQIQVAMLDMMKKKPTFVYCGVENTVKKAPSLQKLMENTLFKQK